MKLLYSIHKYDVTVFFWLNRMRLLTCSVTVFRYVSKTADGPLYILAMLLLWRDELLRSTVLPVFLLAFALERPLYFVLKNSFKRNRPQQALAGFHSVIIPSDQFSFPSGHTSAAFLMVSLLGHYFPAVLPWGLVWAVWVGMSRVMLGVHFPTDTLAGASMGMAVAYLSMGLLD